MRVLSAALVVGDTASLQGHERRLASGLDVAEGRNGAFSHLISAPRNPLMPLTADGGAKILRPAKTSMRGSVRTKSPVDAPDLPHPIRTKQFRYLVQHKDVMLPKRPGHLPKRGRPTCIFKILILILTGSSMLPYWRCLLHYQSAANY